MRSRPGRPLALLVASGASGVVALTLLNVAADRLGGGLAKFRDYVIRRNG